MEAERAKGLTPEWGLRMSVPREEEDSDRQELGPESHGFDQDETAVQIRSGIRALQMHHSNQKHN